MPQIEKTERGLVFGDPVKIMDDCGAELCRGKINSYDATKDWFQVEFEHSLPKFINYPAHRVWPV